MALFDVIKQRDRSLINTPLKTSKNYPTITEKSWWAVRNKFKASIPSVVTPSYILSFLPLNSIPSANSNVVVPLKRMGLIDFNGVPTSLAKQWRLDQEYKKVCKKILELVYPPELLALFPDSVIDRPLVKSWFMAQGIGEESSRKMARVFCMLKTSDLKKVSMEYRKKKIPVYPMAPSLQKKALAKIPMITHDPRCILISKYTFLPTQPQSL